MSYWLAVAGLWVVAAFVVPVASAAACPNVEVVFARGTGEAPGLGIVGTPFTEAVQKNLPGESVGSYAVNYAASEAQTSASEGAMNMSEHVEVTAASCPGTKFVLGGYSQGARVTDISIGIALAGTGRTIAPSLAAQIAAIVVFGNPLRASGATIADSSPLYGSRAKEYCNIGDPVCGNGSNFAAHLEYASNGDAAAGGLFAALAAAHALAGSASPAGTNSTPMTNSTGGTHSALATHPVAVTVVRRKALRGFQEMLAGTFGKGTQTGSMASGSRRRVLTWRFKGGTIELAVEGRAVCQSGRCTLRGGSWKIKRGTGAFKAITGQGSLSGKSTLHPPREVMHFTGSVGY